jgi:hypothetical protein
MPALSEREYTLPAEERRARIAATIRFLRSCPPGTATLRGRTWFVDQAVNRRAGWMENRHDRHMAQRPNHRGGFPRKATADFYFAAWRLSREVNQPRLIVRRGHLGHAACYEARLRHRLTYPGDES